MVFPGWGHVFLCTRPHGSIQIRAFEPLLYTIYMNNLHLHITVKLKFDL